MNHVMTLPVSSVGENSSNDKRNESGEYETSAIVISVFQKRTLKENDERYCHRVKIMITKNNISKLERVIDFEGVANQKSDNTIGAYKFDGGAKIFY
jgi:hypothetical protein